MLLMYLMNFSHGWKYSVHVSRALLLSHRRMRG